MTIMPANSTGWFWVSLARETGRLGHLYSPGAERGPWPWFPYALDNGAFSCWDMKTNTFDTEKWAAMATAWRQLLFWSQASGQQALWAIVPDVIGNGPATLAQWPIYAAEVVAAGIPLAIAVQDGMTVEQVKALSPAPAVIAIGGSTEFKWGTVEMWCGNFPRVHLLRCNMPEKLDYLYNLGVESTDGTGWNQGTRTQTAGVERWCRSKTITGPRVVHEMWNYCCRGKKDKDQTTFA